MVDTLLKAGYSKCWTEHIKNNKKFELYANIKSNIGFENYLNDIKNRDYRLNFTNLRLSGHNLRVEIGRHKN